MRGRDFPATFRYPLIIRLVYDQDIYKFVHLSTFRLIMEHIWASELIDFLRDLLVTISSNLCYGQRKRAIIRSRYNEFDQALHLSYLAAMTCTDLLDGYDPNCALTCPYVLIGFFE